MKKLLLTFVSTLAAAGIASADHIWLNEFHYDDVGADIGEFVEIAVRSGPAFNAADYILTLYNGGTGASYDTANLSTFAASAPFSIANSSETITLFSLPITLQNGAPDGIALSLISTPGTAIFFLSYEGSFAATNGAANGVTSMDIGIAEGDGTPDGASLGLVGTGDSAAEFSWAVNSDDSPGAVNAGQTFAAPIPEPSTYMLLGVGVLICAQQFRRRAKNKR